MVARLADLIEHVERDRRWRILTLLAERPRTEAELRRHVRFGLTLSWHLRALHALGLVAYNRRADRYHLVRPAVEALASFCAQLDEEAGLAAEPARLAEAACPERLPAALATR